LLENSTGCQVRRGVSPRPRGGWVKTAGGHFFACWLWRNAPGIGGNRPPGAPPGTRRPAGVRAVTMTHPTYLGSGPVRRSNGRPVKPYPCDQREVGHGPTTYQGRRRTGPDGGDRSTLRSTSWLRSASRCGRLPLPPVQPASRSAGRAGARGAGVPPTLTRAIPRGATRGTAYRRLLGGICGAESDRSGARRLVA
jgi:hypothetical protein